MGMTREELKRHCEKQIENCEMWARCKGEEPHGKIYEEHKLILELLEQEPILDNIRTEIMSLDYIDEDKYEGINIPPMIDRDNVLDILDKYKAESEG